MLSSSLLVKLRHTSTSLLCNKSSLTLYLIFEGKCCTLIKIHGKSPRTWVFIYTGIDLSVISSGGNHAPRNFECYSKYVPSFGKFYLTARLCLGIYIFFCPHAESPDYQRAARPWRTAVSELMTRFLFLFFPPWIFFFQALSLVYVQDCPHIFSST